MAVIAPLLAQQQDLLIHGMDAAQLFALLRRLNESHQENLIAIANAGAVSPAASRGRMIRVAVARQT